MPPGHDFGEIWFFIGTINVIFQQIRNLNKERVPLVLKTWPKDPREPAEKPQKGVPEYGQISNRGSRGILGVVWGSLGIIFRAVVFCFRTQCGAGAMSLPAFLSEIHLFLVRQVVSMMGDIHMFASSCVSATMFDHYIEGHLAG